MAKTKQNPIIDGLQINLAHFGAMTKDEAVKNMLADGFCVGKNDKEKKDWASKAYDAVKAEYDKPEEEAPAAQGKAEEPKK